MGLIFIAAAEAQSTHTKATGTARRTTRLPRSKRRRHGARHLEEKRDAERKAREEAAAAKVETERRAALYPELLEALKMGYADTMDYIQRNHLSGAENNRWLVLARAAIAKAEGEKT